MEKCKSLGRKQDSMIKVASIVWYQVLPARFGGQKGIASFNNQLAKHYPLVCMCSYNNKSEKPLPYKMFAKLPTSRFQFFNPLCWIMIIRIVKKEKVTHLILEHPYHGIAGWLAKKLLRIKLVVHSHNIESQRFKKLGKCWWQLLEWFEEWIHRAADLSLFKTENDQTFAVRKFGLKLEKCIVIPYGIDKPCSSLGHEEAYRIICIRHRIMLNTKLLLFMGTLDYAPNAKAVEAIVDKIIPLLSARNLFPFRVIICGRNNFPAFQYLKSLQHKYFIYAGEVDEIDTYLKAADVFINPVVQGGGIQTKVIEAVRLGCNVVAFKKNLRGIAMEVCREKVFPVSWLNWEAFTDQIIVASSVHEPTPHLFYDYYSWKRIISGLVERLS